MTGPDDPLDPLDPPTDAANEGRAAADDALGEAEQALDKTLTEAQVQAQGDPPLAPAPADAPVPVAPATGSLVSPEVPPGVKTLGLVVLAVGAILLVLGLLALGLGSVAGVASSLFGDGGAWGLAGWGFGQLVIGGILMAVGGGLRSGRRWAWLLAVIVAAVLLVNGLASWMSGIWCLVPPLLIFAAVLLWYLFRPHVKAAFGRS